MLRRFVRPPRLVRRLFSCFLPAEAAALCINICCAAAALIEHFPPRNRRQHRWVEAALLLLVLYWVEEGQYRARYQ